MRRLMAAVTLSLVACAGTSTLDIVDSWARPSPSGTENAAIYLTIENNTDSADTITSVTAEGCGQTMLHETVDDDGVMGMRHMDEAEIPAGGTFVMEPGSYHIMCMGVVEQLVVGDEVEVTVGFGSGETLAATVPVEDR